MCNRILFMLPVLQYVYVCSAPCVPQNLLPITDCSSDSITFTWNSANGALFYFASVRDSSGGSFTCSTTDLNCQITGLTCGTTYNASIISSNYKCNSSVSNRITVETGSTNFLVDLLCTPLRSTALRSLLSWVQNHAQFANKIHRCKHKTFNIAQVVKVFGAIYQSTSSSSLLFSLSLSQPPVRQLKCRPLWTVMGTVHWWAGRVHAFLAPTRPALWTWVEAYWVVAPWTAAAGFPASNAARSMMSASPTTMASVVAGLQRPSAWPQVSQIYVFYLLVLTKTLQWLGACH